MVEQIYRSSEIPSCSPASPMIRVLSSSLCPFVLVQAAPNPIGLPGFEGEAETLLSDRALMTELFRDRFASVRGFFAFTGSTEEQIRINVLTAASGTSHP
jgi:hypothetical protein